MKMLFEIKFKLRLENDKEDNTWFSTGGQEPVDLQMHMSRSLFLGIGSPEEIVVTIAREYE